MTPFEQMMYNQAQTQMYSFMCIGLSIVALVLIILLWVWFRRRK